MLRRSILSSLGISSLLGLVILFGPARTARSAGELMNFSFDDVMDKLVIIECQSSLGKSAGSGFIAKVGGNTYIFTNQHVILGADQIEFTTVTGKRLKPTSIELSVTRDIARFRIADQDSLNITDDVAIDAPIAVYGNSEGARVATKLHGNVTGVGADVIEVSAQFVAGNSGSPVLNKDMEVIGIASYVTYSSRNETSKGTKFENKVRRFCYRINGVEWVTVNWKKYNGELGKAYRETEQLMDGIFGIINGWANDPFGPVSDEYRSYELKRWAKEHNSMVKKIQRFSDKGVATQKELDSTNKKIRNDIGDSAEALSTYCKRRARNIELKTTNKELTGFLKDELESYVAGLEIAAMAIDEFGEELSKLNYFYFKK